MLRKLDILLRLKARGGRNPTAPNRWVGNFRFGLTDYQASTPFESVWGRSMGSLLGVPHLSSRFRPRSRDSYCLSESDAHAQSWFCLGASDTDRLRLRLQRTRTRSYFVWCLPGGCYLHRGHTLVPKWADTHTHTHTHTRTASFRRSATLGS
jgi:hypothetical protein